MSGETASRIFARVDLEPTALLLCAKRPLIAVKKDEDELFVELDVQTARREGAKRPSGSAPSGARSSPLQCSPGCRVYCT